jgi:hypothetical protein
MPDDNEDIFAFLDSFGFSPVELNLVLDEFDSFRTIPGTTLRRYMNRVISTIDEDNRPAFLKGILLGIAIREAVDALSEPPLSEEERRINQEIERLQLGR